MQKENKMLAQILSSKVRAEIFKLLFGADNAVLHMREIERKSGFSIRTVQRELNNLVKLELLKKTKDGNRTYFQANKENPVFPDIYNLVQKTVGWVSLLKNALSETADIDFAFVFGSFASGTQKSHSDIDLMIIGNISLRKLISVLSGISEKTGREINPHVFDKTEFLQRIRNNDHFISNVTAAKKIFLLGKEDEFKKLVK